MHDAEGRQGALAHRARRTAGWDAAVRVGAGTVSGYGVRHSKDAFDPKNAKTARPTELASFDSLGGLRLDALVRAASGAGQERASIVDPRSTANLTTDLTTEPADDDGLLRTKLAPGPPVSRMRRTGADECGSYSTDS